MFSCWRNFSCRCHRANIYSTLFLLTCLPPFPQSAGLSVCRHCRSLLKWTCWSLGYQLDYSSVHPSRHESGPSGSKRAVLDSKTTNSLSQQQLLARSCLRGLWVFSITGYGSGRRTGSCSSQSTSELRRGQGGRRYHWRAIQPTPRASLPQSSSVKRD